MPYRPDYPIESPYHFTSIVGRFMTYYIHRTVQPHHLDKISELNNYRYVHHPDNLAFDLYGSADLFWVIPVRNGLQDPVFDLEYGTLLIIPDPSYVRSLVT